jgi:hypothetical protein
MKTIKQIREEYDSKFLNQVFPEEIMLEGADKGDTPFSNRVPSSKEMPIMLIFKRVQFRNYPNKLTVALYYSKALDKYLTIPFGPKGNVNLSEAVLLEPEMLDEDWKEVNRKDNTSGMSQKAVNAYRREHPGSKLQTAVTEKNPSGKRASRRKSFCSRMGGMKKRLTSAKTANDPDSRINKALRRWRCEESFRAKLEEKRQERLDEIAPLIAAAGEALLGLGARAAASGAVRSAAGAVARGATRLAGSAIRKGARVGKWALKKALAPGKPEAKAKPEDQPSGSGPIEKPRPEAKVHSFSASSLAHNRAGDTTKSIESQAAKRYAKGTLAGQVQENKVSDLRKLVNENSTMNLQINGRTVTLNSNMAKRIVEVYDSVNAKNKKVVESMLNEDLESFKKLLNFSIKV